MHNAKYKSNFGRIHRAIYDVRFVFCRFFLSSSLQMTLSNLKGENGETALVIEMNWEIRGSMRIMSSQRRQRAAAMNFYEFEELSSLFVWLLCSAAGLRRIDSVIDSTLLHTAL